MHHFAGRINALILLAPAGFALIAGPAAKCWGQVPDEPVKWTVKAQTMGNTLKPGERFTLQLTASIEGGWHLYSTEQAEGGPNPTRIVMPPGQPFEQAGTIASSQPKSAFDPNFNVITDFYDEEAAFTIPAKVAAAAPAGKAEVRVNVSFQTCNNEICLPPKTVRLAAAVNIVLGDGHQYP